MIPIGITVDETSPAYYDAAAVETTDSNVATSAYSTKKSATPTSKPPVEDYNVVVTFYDPELAAFLGTQGQL